MEFFLPVSFFLASVFLSIMLYFTHSGFKSYKSMKNILPLPQVGPANEVLLQSHTYLFHPSTHFPSCMHGFEVHFGGIKWQDDWIEPDPKKERV